VVVGAGPAGLAAGAMLRARGIDPVLLDRTDRVGDGWRRHYDATGFARGLEPLVGHLGLLGPHGPETHPQAPGLYFIGFTNPISGNLREIGIDARRLASAVARDSAATRHRPKASSS
jgi:2-polyprenyl-6-methoxyphenol hydroxylase-like FAD-dependent oxidoreductase